MNRFRTILYVLTVATIAALSSEVMAQQAPPPPPAGNADEVSVLKKRIADLERQIADLQTVIGTLETLAGNGGGGGSVPGYITERLDAMETQIRALSGQMGKPYQSPPSYPGRQGSVNDPSQPRDYAAAPGQLAPQPQSGNEYVPSARRAGDFGGFGTEVRRNTHEEVTVEPLPAPGFGSMVDDNTDVPLSPLPAQGAQAERRMAAMPRGSADPKALYEEAYGELMQRNYNGAASKFSEFIRLHPKDSLAGNAQFWLGETHYVRGDYRQAAENFLKGYKNYKNGNKAADSLLKLAMSLKQLGQKDAACTTLRELTAKYPNAPRHVRQRADTERQRGGC